MRENSILFHFRFNSGNYRFSQSKDNLRTTQVKEKGGKFKQESFNYPESFLYCLYSSLQRQTAGRIIDQLGLKTQKVPKRAENVRYMSFRDTYGICRQNFFISYA